MKIVQINTCNFGSTGKIMLGTGNFAVLNGNVVQYAYASSRSNAKKHKKENAVMIGSIISRNLNLILGNISGYNGCFSYFGTKRLLRKINIPDIIHLHNLHNGYINIPLLFRYIKKHNIPVIWTLHDCWSFTGHCPHFTMANCDKWKTGCHDCPSYKDYPSSMFDNSKKMYKLKKKWFTGVQNMTIVTPSQWLADLAKQSYLKDYPVKVINNGIDLSIFKSTPNDFRQKHGIKEDEYILLGVAFGWGVRKGFDVFLSLAKRLPKQYRIVLVGTDDTVNKQLPDNIISIHRTQNQAELAEIYSAADLFVNPTREENYPTVNMESLACGTPVLTFKTGGSPEIINDTCGAVVDCDDVDALEKGIRDICEDKKLARTDCIEHAKSFDMNEKFKEYFELYASVSLL